MKARVKDESIILSIGMIVKNEEKKLRRCLDSLQPLMEQVTSELIIVDTGSEDSTKDIAREYTGQVYDFEWCNDFAAARNYGLDKSSGKWFLFLDADEVLKEPEELIRFFNSGKSSEKYYTGMLICHSPMDKEESIVSRLWVSRLFSKSTGNRFYGKIHEIPRVYQPVKRFRDTYLWHDGYMYETIEDAERKRDRNNKLLEEELAEQPDSLRIISHYSATCPYEKREELLQHGRELLQTQPDNYYMSDIYWRLSRMLLGENKNKEVIELYEEYKELTEGKNHIGEIELAMNAGTAYAYSDQFDKAIEAYQRYLYLYHEYYYGDILETDTMSSNCEMISKDNLSFVLEKCAACYERAGRSLEAFEMLMEIDFTAVKLINPSADLRLALSCAEELNRFDLVCKLDDWIKEQNLENIDLTEYKNGLIRFLCKTFWTDGQLEKALSDMEGLDGELSDLFRLLSPEADWARLDEKLNQDKKYMGSYQALLLCCALRFHHNPSVLLAAVGRDRLSDAGEAIALFTPAAELADMLLSWEAMPVSNEVLFCGWMADLYGKSFSNCPEEKKLPILHKMVEELSWYTFHLYHPDLLVPNETKLLALPSAHRFGYWSGLALGAEKNGDHLQYIKYLRAAAESCPEMGQAVKMLVQEARENDPVYQQRKEQEQLAAKIKEVIEGFILNGNLEGAKAILEQYEIIAPNDPDIPTLKAALVQEPSFTEA